MKTTTRLATLAALLSMLVVMGSAHAANAAGPSSNAGGLPTSMQECENGGWSSFGVFKNQGDCVSFVATQGRNRPALQPTAVFGPPTYYPPGSRAFVASGDFNGDGHADVAATNPEGSVGVFLNRGDGILALPVDFPVPIPFELTAGDFNLDGFDDLAVPCCSPTDVGTALLIFFSNGDGTFGAPMEYPGVGHRAAAADFNGDGRADIAVTASVGAVSVLLNNGNGTFASPVPYGTDFGAAGIAVGDMNGDAHPDIATANTASGTVSILLNNGNGTFSAAASYGAGDSPWKIAVGDLDSDSAPDVAVTNASTGTVSVLLNLGNGTLSAPASYSAGSSPGGIGIADFDGDSDRDLVVGNIIQGVSVLFNTGDGTFTGIAATAVDDVRVGLVVADFNDDGRPDVSVAAGFSGVAVLLEI